MAKIKVLHVVYSLDPGGMENGVVNVSNLIDVNRFEVYILCISRIGGMADRLLPHVKVHCLNKKNGFDFKVIKLLSNFIRIYRPDIVHGHNLGPLIYLSLSLFFVQYNVRIIQGEHASLTKNDLSVKKLFQRIILYSYCSCVHTVGYEMSKLFSNSKLFKIHPITLQNGVDTSKFLPAVDAREYKCAINSCLDGKITLSLIARYGKYKGHILVLEAFEIIAAKYDNIWLMFIGGGGEMEEVVLGRVKTHRYSHRIICTGFQLDPLPYYLASDFIILASQNEGLSNVMLESMSCAIPVIALNSCGVKELVTENENGYIVQNATLSCLSSTVGAILEKSSVETSNVGRCARDFIVEEYSLHSMMQNYSNVYANYGIQMYV